MPVECHISDDDIALAERLLLKTGKTFDDERKAFIRRLDTLDLQAVPGSGKTTALLAKLVALERYLPFEDGSGVLVISHTNTAVDEIQKNIGNHCPRLFSYPNYVGTIQGFVDRFLAIPYYVSRRKMRPTRIRNEDYEEAVDRFLAIRLPGTGFTTEEQKRGMHYLRGSKNRFTYRLSLVGGIVNVKADVRGNELTIKKPKGKTRQGNYSDWSDQEKSRVEGWLKEFKLRILRDGILCFDDAYFLADCYLSRCPGAKELIRRRFRYVFVDEMQDMGKHQHDLLEQLFFDDVKCRCGYQRIGDRNQAIYDRAAEYIEAKSVWRDRASVLTLANSCRLSAPVARIVEPFAVERDSKFRINGLGEADITPRLIVYDDDSRKEVIQWFSYLLSKMIRDGTIPYDDDTVFKVVAWNAEWPKAEGKKGEVKRNGSKVRLVDYSSFTKANDKPPLDHECVENYLRFFDRTAQTLGPAQTNIVRAFLKVLRLEDARSPNDAGHFTSHSLFKHLSEKPRKLL